MFDRDYHLREIFLYKHYCSDSPIYAYTSPNIPTLESFYTLVPFRIQF
jgi:hypothetical protein